MSSNYEKEKAVIARIRLIMKQKHRTQQQLADHMGYHNRVSVSAMLTNRSNITLIKLFEIADFLGVEAITLLGGFNHG